MDDSTQTCLARALAGDASARGELLERHVARLRAFVRPRLGARLRARESSLDVVQSVFREALRGMDAFEQREGSGGEGFGRWLLRVADSKLKSRGRFWNRLRRASAVEASDGEFELERLGDGGAASPSGAARSREELERVEAAFATLPAAWRQVVVLVRLQGLSHAEAARRMGRTESATRTLLSRALARLATELEEPSRRDGDAAAHTDP
ncbi:MAG TPA: RNA polymerase sigma factor [Planctomycetota bacterium]|nr:RNA polymerase sigma factor [Planctomycetota bacterium]